MKTPEKIVSILNALEKDGIKIPMSVKCRIGVDDLDSYEYLHNFVSD